ncbi:MAG: heavy-metal-associated domain-containing protein [Rhodospirillales bacterium]|nr:MAG: heavy-metal-associated domain-containing protein [Rhodospirillales bacterium]
MQTVQVRGMTCGGCVRSLTVSLERAGVKPLSVDLASGIVAVPDGVDATVVRRAIEAAGFVVADRG